jgi:hypothetical protein
MDLEHLVRVMQWSTTYQGSFGRPSPPLNRNFISEPTIIAWRVMGCGWTAGPLERFPDFIKLV